MSNLLLFVTVACVVIVLLVIVLTLITQLPEVEWVVPWEWLRGVKSSERSGPRKPGRKARRTQRKRVRLASLKAAEKTNAVPEGTAPSSSSVNSAFELYEQHLHEERESERRKLLLQLQNIITQRLEFPCRGCGVVNAKRNCNNNCCADCCRDKKNSVCRAHGTGYLAAEAAVESATHHAFLEFDMSYAHLRSCPPNVSLIGPQLMSLNLSNNRLSSLPSDIGKLCNLEELFLQYNCLTRLPDSVCCMTELKELDVKNNRLKELPENIGCLSGLLIFSVTNNHIGHLPKSMENLQMLEELSLHSNHLTELPSEICNLINLRIVYCGENKLKTLPYKFGQLVNLEELDISGCELVTLPDSLSQCESLVRLWLSNNRLVSLPPHIGDLQQLKELHVRNNRLKYFPASIEKLQLYTFTAQNNCLIDEQTAKALCRLPSNPLPPLLEVAARAVIKYELTWELGSIPRHLDDMLQHPLKCSKCGGPFFLYFSSQVTFKTIGVFFRVPLYQQFCSLHPQTENSTLST